VYTFERERLSENDEIPENDRYHITKKKGKSRDAAAADAVSRGSNSNLTTNYHRDECV